MGVGGGGSVDRSIQLSVDQVRRGSMDRGSVFLGHPCSVCVFISFRDCNWFRVLHAVDSLNVKHY